MANQPKQPGFSISRRIAAAKTKEFSIIDKFPLGYRNREDKTNLPASVLIEGSQNVLTSVTGRVGITQGYKLDGQSSAVLAPILSAFDWESHTGTVHHLRAGFLTDAGNDGKLQYRYVNSDDSVTWNDLLTDLTSVSFNFCDFWNVTNSQAYLLFVNGLSQIYEWSGGTAVVASVSNETGIISSLFYLPTDGGDGYAVNDVLTISGGTGGTATVLAVVNGAVNTVSVNSGGTGYQVGDIITIAESGSPGSGATVTVLTLGGGGAVATISLTTQGSGYDSGDSPFTTTGGQGSGCTINVLTTSNGAISQLSLTTPGTGYSTGQGIATTGGTGTGATVNIADTTANSITITGDKTIAELGFYSDSGEHSLLINGTTYTYTGGQSTMKFIGVLPDPTIAINASDVIVQAVKITRNADTNGLPSLNTTSNISFTDDLISNLRNQIYVSSLTNNSIYISAVNSYTDYTFTQPVRLVGEGALVNADGPIRAMIPQEDYMEIHAGLGQIYKTVFTLSSNLTSESFEINRLKTAELQATQSQALLSKIKNNSIFISNEPILSSLGRVDNVVLTPQITDLSYPIVNDFNVYDFTDGSVAYNKNFIYVAVPKQSLIRIYNMTNQATSANTGQEVSHYWEAPITYPISRFSIIDGDLYGHGYLVSESYKLFTGYNFNGSPIPADAIFAYQQNGIRTTSKSFNEFYVEGYISPNATLDLNLDYELNGFAGSTTYPIDGSDTQIVQISSSSSGEDNSIGKLSLGKAPLGTDTSVTSSTVNKFREIQTFPRTPFYEYSPSFSSSGTDWNWSIIAFGSSSTPTSEGNNPITI